MKKSNDGCEIVRVNEAQVKRAQKRMPTPEQVTKAAELFAALGDPTRVKMVAALAETELCVCDLAALVSMTVSAVSHQLRLLRHLGLVKFRKQGKLAFYTLGDEHAAAILAQVLQHVEHQ
jgi:ArsR family transcriptional regulator, lead/cadmium/zinc/bismuth-responsive transcriptional repressor